MFKGSRHFSEDRLEGTRKLRAVSRGEQEDFSSIAIQHRPPSVLWPTPPPSRLPFLETSHIQNLPLEHQTGKMRMEEDNGYVLQLTDSKRVDHLRHWGSSLLAWGQIDLNASHVANSGRFTNSGRHSGLMMASRLVIGRPCTRSRTATSVIFPLPVRGMAPTALLPAGAPLFHK